MNVDDMNVDEMKVDKMNVDKMNVHLNSYSVKIKKTHPYCLNILGYLLVRVVVKGEDIQPRIRGFESWH